MGPRTSSSAPTQARPPFGTAVAGWSGMAYTWILHAAWSLACAGLAAHPDWVPTLQGLARLHEGEGKGEQEEQRDEINAATPLCIFTDFCEEAALRAEQMVACLCPGLRSVMPVTLNRFRQPLRRWQPDNALPSYSNGFVFAFA